MLIVSEVIMLCFGSNGKKKKRKSILCKVILLDETQVIHELQDTSRGQELMEVVCKHLNLLETAYFGLRFVDKEGQTHWLNLNRRITKELSGSCPSFTLYFGVKFYAVDPCKLLEEITRYQFFLQLKQDIFQSRLPVPSELSAELFALVIQSELGDFDAGQHLNGYVSEFRFIRNQSRELEARVSELHKRLVGQVPAASEMAFLERIKWLDLYGADLHPVLGEDNMEYFIALIPSGVAILRNRTSVANYSWTRIVKFYRKGKFFMIKVCEKNDQEKTVGFELPSEAACKHLENCFLDQQTFFSIAGKDARKSVSILPSSQRLSNNLSSSGDRIQRLSQRFRGSFTARRGGSTILPKDPQDTRRPAPTVVRVPSRRYQRRYTDETSVLDVKDKTDLGDNQQQTHSTLTPIKQQYTANVIGSGGISASLVWEKPLRGGLLTGRSPYDEDFNSVGHRGRSCSRYRQSDNDSYVSRLSRHSHHSCRSHRSQCSHRRHRSHSHSRDNQSGNESETGSLSSSRRRRHRRKHHHPKDDSADQLVDSQPQWLEIQKQQMKQQNVLHNHSLQQSVIKKTQAVTSFQSESGNHYNQENIYSNGQLDFSSMNSVPDNMNIDQKISNTNEEPVVPVDQVIPPRPKKPTKFVSEEVRRFIESNLVDPSADTKEDLSFTQVAPDNRFLQIRYSPTTGRAKCKLTTTGDKRRNGSSGATETPLHEDPVYSNVSRSGVTSSTEPSFTCRSAGSRAPVYVDDIDFAFPVREFGDNEMATEL